MSEEAEEGGRGWAEAGPEMEAVVAQTGFGAALGIELIGRKIWKDAGVFSPEYFPSLPFMELMKESGLAYGIEER